MNITAIIYAVAVFLVVILLLVAILLIAKRYLVSSGNVKVTINGDKVTPGVYLIYVSTKDGREKYATKILIQY